MSFVLIMENGSENFDGGSNLNLNRQQNKKLCPSTASTISQKDVEKRRWTTRISHLAPDGHLLRRETVLQNARGQGQEEPLWFVPCSHGSYMKRDGTNQADDRLSRIPWQFWRSDTVKYADLAGYKRCQI